MPTPQSPAINAPVGAELPSGRPVEPDSLLIELNKEGEIRLDGAVVDQASLNSVIRSARASDGDVVCRVVADKDTKHTQVIALLDLLKAEGIHNIAIQTQRKHARSIGARVGAY